MRFYAFRLAERLGRHDVDVMLSEMSSVALSEWMAYDRVNVTPEERSTAEIVSALANLLGSGKRAYSASDFLPRRRPTRDMAASEQFAVLRGMVPSPEVEE